MRNWDIDGLPGGLASPSSVLDLAESDHRVFLDVTHGVAAQHEFQLFMILHIDEGRVAFQSRDRIDARLAGAIEIDEVIDAFRHRAASGVVRWWPIDHQKFPHGLAPPQIIPAAFIAAISPSRV